MTQTIHACPIVSMDEIISRKEKEVRELAIMIADYGYIVEYRKDPAFHEEWARLVAAVDGEAV